MVAKKLSAFSKADVALAAFAQALSHPARLKILRTLAARDRCVCGELVRVVGLSQATVSQHLRALKDAGLIEGEIAGTRSCYCIDYRTLKRNLQLLERFSRELGASRRRADLSCC